MANTAAPLPGTESPLFDLDEEAVVGADEDSLDLETYLDLEESTEIARLMQQVRDGAIDPAERETPRAASRGKGIEPAAARGPAPRGGSAAAVPGDRPRPAPRAAAPHPAPGAGLDRTAQPPAAPHERGAPRHDGAGRPLQARPLDIEDVARTLGEVQVQGRQLVAACPACDGRPTIVIYANRFKCFGCEATGDGAALAAHLTGWDARRVAQWLASASAAAPADEEVGSGRRPWRLRFFAR